MEIQEFKNLLPQVKSVTDHYLKINELTGENFNVFRILKVESSEIRMHSAFLAELLNPKGRHGQKNIFLKLFVKAFCFKANDFNTDNYRVQIEKHAGFISEGGMEGGRIDIILTDKNNNEIIIENKIYASDQKNQLVRYHAYSPKADLIYLTLNGNLPTNESAGQLVCDQDYKCFSYKVDIINWLELCRKEVATSPIIRESITQYINLIKYLTNQTINKAMKDEVTELLISNVKAAFTISQNIDSMKKALLSKLNDDLGKLTLELGLRFSSTLNISKNHTGFWIWKPNWKFASIGFQFQNYCDNMIYGIATKNDPTKFSAALRSKLSKLGNEPIKPNSWWPISRRMDDPYDNWSNYHVWEAIADEKMIGVFHDKIKEMLQLVEGVDL